MPRPLTTGALALAAAASLLLGSCSSGSDDKADRTTTTHAPTTGTSTSVPTTGTGLGSTGTTPDTTGATGITLSFRPVLSTVQLSPGQVCVAKQEGNPGAGVEGRPPPSAPDTTVPPAATDEVALSSADGRACYGLGAEAFDSTALTGGRAEQVQGQWTVTVSAKAAQKTTVASLFAACYAGDSACPDTGAGQGHGAVAIVLDGMVLTAPIIQTEGLADQPFQLTGGLTEAEAKGIAREIP